MIDTIGRISLMPNRQDLELLDIIHLAVLCGKAADDVSMDADTARKAVRLKHEWALLVVRDSGTDFKTKQKINGQKAELKHRMVNFLATL